MKNISQLAIIFATSISVTMVYAAPAHEHGKAAANIALQGKQLVIDLDTPLDNLLGFEHAPRNDKEKQQVNQMIRRLQVVNSLVSLPQSAKCSLTKVNLSSSVLDAQLPKTSKKTVNPLDDQPEMEQEGHADLDGEFTYTCEYPEKLSSITFNLFKWFPHTQLIHVQWVHGNQQRAFELTMKQPNIHF